MPRGRVRQFQESARASPNDYIINQQIILRPKFWQLNLTVKGQIFFIAFMATCWTNKARVAMESSCTLHVLTVQRHNIP